MVSRNKESIISPKSQARWREIVGVLFIALSLFFLLSLVSYSPLDVSLNSTGTVKGVSNLGGVVGAHLADLIVQALGWAGFLIPALFLFLGVTRFTSKQWGGWFLRAGGGTGFLLAVCILLQVRMGTASIMGGLHRDAGGIVGRLLADKLVQLFNVPGTLILSIALLIASILIMTNISLGKMGLAFLGCFRWIGGLFVKWKERFRRRKAVTRAQDAEAKKTPPRVVVRKAETRNRYLSEPVQEEFETMSRPRGKFSLPPLQLLTLPDPGYEGISEEDQKGRARILEKKLRDFGVEGRVTTINPGPVITVFEYEPAPGVKLNQILNLTGDLSLAMGGVSIRVVPLIPGKTVIGIEIPNQSPELVTLREILSSNEFAHAKGALRLALGKDTAGDPYVTDLDSMPHLLVAGATGTGKSVAINSMILSLVGNLAPHEVRLLLIDPKMLELSPYEGIPHLLAPVVMEPKKAASALRWAVVEMERRYQLLASHGVRDIVGYNRKMAKLKEPPEGDDPHLPHIVVIIDELADLMMTTSREVEECIARLGQMARAAGIHLIIATQRPSVDIVSGNIKNNITGRISFKVFDKANSRVILDSNGAEQLLGRGDMLFVKTGIAGMVRIHGCLVTDEEVNRVARFLREQAQPEYRDDLFDYEPVSSRGVDEHEEDEKFGDVLDFVYLKGYASASMIQRNFKVGYNRAARMIERMEAEGIIGPPDGAKPRPVLRRADIK
ncbi:MAG TPA: DNA translocase FtsK [Proteobacteria bacterium]|nr:DNA translocase FtsK [bacterium BMS3Abin14]HDL53946.1 DNA translocase FtsK [Pseudomonadota bacterium]